MERSSQSISQVLNDGNNMDDYIFLSNGSPITSLGHITKEVLSKGAYCECCFHLTTTYLKFLKRMSVYIL
jgi:hypothetical protein